MRVDADAEPHDPESRRDVFRAGRPDDDAGSSGGAVVLRDDTGKRWSVTEIDGRSVPGSRGASCLVFESETAIRRVWHYPADWRELPGSELIAVSWGR